MHERKKMKPPCSPRILGRLPTLVIICFSLQDIGKLVDKSWFLFWFQLMIVGRDRRFKYCFENRGVSSLCEQGQSNLCESTRRNGAVGVASVRQRMSEIWNCRHSRATQNTIPIMSAFATAGQEKQSCVFNLLPTKPFIPDVDDMAIHISLG